MDFTFICSTNETNDISMNDDDNFSINIMHHFYRQITMIMYLQEHNLIKKNADFSVIKCYFGFIIKEIKYF